MIKLWTEDTEYFVPLRRTRNRRELSKEFTQPGEMAFMHDDKTMLDYRVAKLNTGTAWAEDPPSRTRHFIANIEVEAGNTDGELKVWCNYLVYRSRGEMEQDFYVGAREDVLRQVNGSWKIARRRLILDQNVLSAKNLSIFF